MTVILLAAGGVLVVGLAVVFWRLTGPGKRLRLGTLNLYYTPNVTPDEAKRVGEYLVRQKFEMDARLTRDAATYQLQLICCLGHSDEKQLAACEVLAAGLSDDVFAGAEVEVQVCDRVFRPTSVVRHRGRFGRRIRMNAAHLFYLDGVTDDEAFWVATFLAGVGVFDDSPKIAQMSRGADGYEFRLAVEADPHTTEMLEGARRMANDLSRVLKGAPVAVQFGKGLLGTLRTVQPRAGEHGAANSHVPGGPYHTRVYCLPGQSPDGTDLQDETQGNR